MSERDFSICHPDYERMKRRWQMAWDFYRGGVHVLNPDHEATTVHFARVIESQDSETAQEAPELARLASNYEWVPHHARSFLWKFPSETKNRYEERCARQIHFPLFRQVINIYVAGILRTNPKRVVDGGDVQWSEIWDTYHKDVDLTGNDVNAFMRQALALALAFGRLHAISDRPDMLVAPDTRQDQLDASDRPYSYMFTPLDMTDWLVDEYGRFEWVVIREPVPQHRIPGLEIPSPEYQYRVWYPDGWELWRKKGDIDDELDSGSMGYYMDSWGNHSVGEVPVSTLWATAENRRVSMACESPLADMLDLDRESLNRLSELDELERMQAFAVFGLPVREGMSVGGFDWSPHSAFTYDADSGAPGFFSPDAEITVGKWQRIADKLHVSRQWGGVGRGKAEYSKEERSADALLIESGEKHNQMAIWAAAAEAFDNKLHEHVRALETRPGGVVPGIPVPEYPRNFDIKGVAAQINEVLQLKSADIGKKAVSLLTKPLVARILHEHGISDEEIKKALAAVDTEAEKPEPKPPVFGDKPEDKKQDGSDSPTVPVVGS
jgi:hypothetical protein